MVAPITGPFLTSSDSAAENRLGVSIRREKWKQKRPYNLNLSYLNQRLATTGLFTVPYPGYGLHPSYTYPGNWNPWWVYAVSPDWFGGLFELQYLLDQCMNDARAKFIKRLGETAALGVAALEGRQAMEMITKRVTQLLDFTRKLKKGDVRGAAGVLGYHASPPRRDKTGTALYILSRKGQKAKNLKIREGSRNFSSNYLEFHFGWSPLVGDIYSACQVLSEPFKGTRVRGVARRKGELTKQNMTSGLTEMVAIHRASVVCRVQADVAVSNPNLNLASRLGLTNPALVITELVPFSFVLDWFVNVSDFLGQFTDTQGYTIENSFHTYAWEDNCYCRETNTQTHTAFGFTWVKGDRWNCSSVAFSTRRKLGLPNVKLGFRSPWTVSPRRALAAISLLIQQGISAVPKTQLGIVSRRA